MWNKLFGIVLALILLIFKSGTGREITKQQNLNANTDFLFHETGGNVNVPVGPKKDQVFNAQYNPQNRPSTSVNQDYNSQFPALKPSNTQTSIFTENLDENKQTRVTQSTGRRDYVAPLTTPKTVVNQNNQASGGTVKDVNKQTTRVTESTGKRDYVAPHTTPKTVVQQNNQASGGTVKDVNKQTTRVTEPTGKRDYVAPHTTPKNVVQQNNQASGGKVKDLINFYDDKSKQNIPAKPPSWSSVLQGNTGKKGVTSAVSNSQTAQTHTTPKFPITGNPSSYSSMVTRNNKPIPTGVTSRPLTPPANTVLPSTLVNNNNNQGNANGPSDTDLQTLSEELLRKDVNNAAKYITINYQGKTTSHSSEDKAPLPLITVGPEVWNIPTVQKFVPLLDNYERDTLVNEYVTPQERNEENAFMDAIMSTTVIRHLMNFFKDRGYVSPDPRQQRDFLKQLWFSLYSRGKGKLSSSGFEHVFVSELKNGEVSGLHNWLYFSIEEAANRANYLGYLKHIELNDKGAVLKHHFTQQGVDKPVDSLFIGTSPELEIALYTLCFVTRADNDCNLKLANQDVNIRTHTFRYRSKNHIGSAFPQI